MPIRQKLETFERKPKRVHFLTGGALTKDADHAQAILAAVNAIEGGAPLPSGYYRKGVGATRDGLLEADGIMHLHLGKSNTPELLYVVQYPDDVVILELSDHSHFLTRPAGRLLRGRHAAALAVKEAELDLLLKPKRPKWDMKARRGPIPTKPTKKLAEPTPGAKEHSK